MHWEVDLILKKVMARSNCLVNSNSSEVKRFMKNDKSIDGVFEYMFIDTGKIVEGLEKMQL